MNALDPIQLQGTYVGDLQLTVAESGTEATLAQITAGQPTLLVLARHRDCPLCEMHLGRLIKARGRIGRIVVVGMEAPEQLQEVANGLPFEFVCLSDEQRRSYTALGARRPRLPLFALSPKVLIPLTRHLAKGRPLVRRGGDLMQMGADIIVDPAGRVAWANLSASPGDRPSVETIIEQMDQVRAQGQRLAA
jgi:hypothetical protein